MNKTIKQIADEIGVSKTAVRKKMDMFPEFRENYVETIDNVITINEEGCRIIAETFSKPAETFRKPQTQTPANDVSADFIEFLKAQLEEKDRQIAAQQRQLEEQQRNIAELTSAVKSQAQSINADRHNALAGTMQQQLGAAASDPESEEKAPSKGFFAKLFKK